MAGVKIEFDLKALDDIAKSLNPNLRMVGESLDLAGGYAANTWESAAYGAKLPGMTRSVHSPRLAQSIQHHMHGELEVVISADEQELDAATRAKPAWDMKPGLLSGPKARRSKTRGTRYNIILFRHKFADLSDEAIMALAANVRNFQSELGRRSKILGIGFSPLTFMNNSYQYVKNGPIAIAATRYTWKTGIESGIRLSMGSGPITFRTVSDASDPASWWYPARPENPMVEAVWAAVKDDVEAWVYDAWVNAFLGGGRE